MASELKDTGDPAVLYERDFYAWAKHQAAALREIQSSRPNLLLDFAHLIEEVEDLGESRVRAVKGQLRRLIVHYLKLEYSPVRPPRRTWQVSIVDAQGEIETDMTPSIRREVEQDLNRIYKLARRLAAAELLEHDEPEAARSLPATCPYSLDQLLDEDWRPANRHGLLDEPV